MKATGILIALALAAPAGGAAQRPARPAHGPSAMSRTAETNSFKGIASKLNTTPDALETAWQAAREANPKLRRSQFVAANVLGQNLVDKHPAITTQAILDGLKSGKTMGLTLQGLGLSAAEAQAAQRDADKEIRAAKS